MYCEYKEVEIMANNEKIVLQVNDYNRMDGKFAYSKKDKKY